MDDKYINQVKIIHDDNLLVLEKLINDFIKDKNILEFNSDFSTNTVLISYAIPTQKR